MEEYAVECPRCGENNPQNLHVGHKGFGLAKAGAGAILIGPVGLLAGFIGSKKLKIACLSCGKTWKYRAILRKTVDEWAEEFNIVITDYSAFDRNEKYTKNQILQLLNRKNYRRKSFLELLKEPPKDKHW